MRLDQLVLQQAERTPHAPALRNGPAVLTYADLVAQARQLACALRRQRIERGDLVAVCLDRSFEQITGILGVLLAGAAYVPIDPLGPAERRRFMLEDSQPRAIVTTETFRSLMPGESLPPIGTPQDLAYVIYTSGSTGLPKGVLNQHDGITNHLAWMAETFPLSTDDRVLAKTPAVFDVSVWEWFWPLSQGACLVLTSPGGEKDPPYLLEMIEAQRITNIHFVPTLLRLFLERRDLDRCHSLQRVFCSGEALTAELRDRFFQRMPGPPALIDLYGPTETAVHVTGWTCTPGETGPVPIGLPLPNVRAYIVDEQLSPVPPGVQGELLIGGIQVARGYLRRPDLTRERFIPDPFVNDAEARCYRTGDCVAWRADGAIDFFGRFDSQVQLGGVRVELGEIEAALRLHPSVADAAVVVREGEASKRLVAYLRRARTGGAEPDPPVESVRRFLADTIADYMTPGWYVWLDAFPVTTTGKLDRRALPSPDVHRPVLEQPFEPPLSGSEARLARLWCDELQVDRVGRHDDYHWLGGDSLSAIRLCEAIAAEFGVDLRPGEFLHSPTVALLAARLGADRTHVPAASIITLRAGGERQPIYLPPSMGGELLYWREFVRALAPGRPVYGFTLAVDAEAPADLPALAAGFVGDLIAFQPKGPYHLAGYSFSAAVALEMAQQLRASGRTVGLLAMIDYGPGEPDGWLTRARTARHFARNLPHWLGDDILQAGWAAVAGRTWRKLAAAGDRVANAGRGSTAQSAERAFDQMFDHLRLPEAHRRLAIDQLDAFYRYQPAVYDGRVLLCRARSRPLFHSLAPSLGWEHYAAGGFDRVDVACNHDNIMRAPHAGVIAAAVDRALGSA